ncbi:MAG: ABC transporter substrate-binding protein [Alphaproteobacteria bacterium]|nr:ABC transporter substrate-binding protein [Alphaproteobacteria bacterium]
MARILTILSLTLTLGIAPLQAADTPSFEALMAEAEGQTIYFNAWGGDETINGYIAWVGDQVQDRYGVTLKHVKLADTAEAVARVLAEKTAGRADGGSIDLIWINGENFASMKEQDLLFGPFVADLPNFAHVDVEGKPTTVLDFTVPTDGLEAPWGMAQFVFFHDSERVAEPPRTIPDLLAWAKANPGRFTHPSPPDFIGSTFLKHLMIAYIDDPAILQEPVDGVDFAEVTAGLWQALEDVRPALWRQGETYPANGPGLHQLLDDGEVDFSMAFNPAEASAAISAGTLPESVRSFIPETGSIGNTHFVAIPFNAAHQAGAQVVANFLMAPEAQAKKQDPEGWGDWTVLDVAGLDPEDRARFEDLSHGIATLSPEELTPVLPEPHPSWMTRIEAEWLRRFSS